MMSDTRTFEIAGRTITIRPIRPTDLAMEQEFVRRLSPQSRRQRFLCAIRELSTEEAERFCDVDGHRSMAFVATVEESGRPRQIGVSRYAPGPDDNAREIAVTVADDWQHRGIGTHLAEALIQHARGHGIGRLVSMDLADNAQMRMLAHDLGMESVPDPDNPCQVIYSLHLGALPSVAEA